MTTGTRIRPAAGFLGLLCLALLFSCAHPATATRQELAGLRGRPRISISKLEKRIHALINNERKKHGLAALAWSSRLSEIAARHSKDMATRRYFSHYSPEERDFAYRYKAGGYSCEVRVGNVAYCGGENIFRNNLYNRILIRGGEQFYDWNSLERIAETTVEGWMNSPGHRKNILTPHFRSEGIGVSISDGRVFITQNFC
jgi:uncharacterized protein YkwD